MPSVQMTCPRCEGCGQLANSDDAEPWTAWQDLPPGSDLAVRLGLVKPVPCPACAGTGGRPEPAAEPAEQWCDVTMTITGPAGAWTMTATGRVRPENIRVVDNGPVECPGYSPGPTPENPGTTTITLEGIPDADVRTGAGTPATSPQEPS